MRARLVCRTVLITCLLTVASAASAQQWPTKPVRLVVPFAPGGSVGYAAQLIAHDLSDRLGQRVILDHRPGAAGLIGVDAAAKAAPDGYTFVITTSGNIAVSPHLNKKMPFDPIKDLTPITPIAETLAVLVVHPSLPVKSVKDLITLAKQRPGSLNFGSSGPGGSDHMSVELFMNMTGIKMVHVPYKGGGPAMNDLIAGNIQLMFSTIAPAIEIIKAGRVRALAVTSSSRFAALPDLPTVSEAGLPGYEATGWYGIFGPAGLPTEVVKKMHAATVAALSTEALRNRFKDSGLLPVSDTPERFAALIRQDTDKWGKLVLDNGIKAD